MSDLELLFREAVERAVPAVSDRVDAAAAWQAGRPRRRVWLPLAGVAATAAVVVAVVAVAWPGASPKHPAAQGVSGGLTLTGPVTVQGPVATVPDDSGIPGVVRYRLADLAHTHVDGPVRYSVTPPVGGPHNPTWLDCGSYPSAVASELAVHDLEHGAVWITYRFGLPAAEVAALRSFVGRQSDATLNGLDLGNRYVDLSPAATLPAPIVISAWGAQLRLDDPTDPRLQRFVDAFRVKPAQTYEAGASCTGGVGTPLPS